MVKYSWRQKKNRNELTEVLLYQHLFLHGRKVYRCMIYLWRYGLVFEKMTGTSSLKKMGIGFANTSLYRSVNLAVPVAICQGQFTNIHILNHTYWLFRNQKLCDCDLYVKKENYFIFQSDD